MASKLITTKELTGMRVIGGKKGNKRIGKIRRFVFHPKEKRVIGFVVKRPDLLWMFHRSDQFVPIDGYDLVDGRVVLRPDAATSGKAACKAMGLSWDDCVIWVGLPVMTESGSSFGYVGDVTFNRLTGAVESFETDSGAASNALLGKRSIPTDMIRGFKRGMGAAVAPMGAEGVETSEVQLGAMLVADEVAQLDSEGGVAEAAGQATAVAMDKVQSTVDKAKPAVSKATAAAGEAVNKGAYATGRQISRSKNMFKDFKSEYDKAVAPSGSKSSAKAAVKSGKGAGSKSAGAAADAVDVAAAGTKVSTTTSTTSQSAKSSAKKTTKKSAPKKKKNMFAAFKEEYDKASR